MSAHRNREKERQWWESRGRELNRLRMQVLRKDPAYKAKDSIRRKEAWARLTPEEKLARGRKSLASRAAYEKRNPRNRPYDPNYRKHHHIIYTFGEAGLAL